MDLLEAIAELGRVARLDQLTGLGNVLALQEDSKKAAMATDRSWYYMFGDLNGFKAVNDNHGHAAGDAVIRYFGERLHHICGKWNSQAYRKGGDEFALLIPAEELENLLADLNQEFVRCRIKYENKALEASASFGYLRMGDVALKQVELRAEAACGWAKSTPEGAGRKVTIEWTNEQQDEKIERRFRCDGCGTSTKCTFHRERFPEELKCPVCEKPHPCRDGLE